MNIYVNGKFLTQRMTGVQRYAFELTHALLELGIDLKIIVPPGLNIDNAGLPAERIVVTGRLKNMTLWEQIDLPKYLSRVPDPVLLSLCNTGPLLIKKQVVCIHDMSYLENPKWFSRTFYYYYRFMIPEMLKRADHVITVSQFSKNEISSKLRFPGEKISVIYNAPARKFVNSSAEAINYEKDDFFLFVGSLDPRKNLKTLIEVFASGEVGKFNLVIVGAKSRTLNYNGKEFAPNVRIMDRCDDQTLGELYRKAKGLVNCSFYEGFGLPLVEAMASGCPLVLSDIPVFREIAGSNAFYFSPDSPSSIKRALNSFLNESDSLINTHIRENYELSLKYNWKRSGAELLNVLQNNIL